MKTIRDFLEKLEAMGVIVRFVVSMLIIIFPVVMLDIPFVLCLILSTVLQLFSGVPFVIEIAYIVGLFGVISGEQDFLAILYYILFTIIIGSTIINLIRMRRQ